MDYYVYLNPQHLYYVTYVYKQTKFHVFQLRILEKIRIYAGTMSYRI